MTGCPAVRSGPSNGPLLKASAVRFARLSIHKYRFHSIFHGINALLDSCDAFLQLLEGIRFLGMQQCGRLGIPCAFQCLYETDD